MKIDRRLFVKATAFAGGGALGLMSSRAPWHLIRDMARWTQNWPWVPAPAQGKPSMEKSACPMCEGGCGVVVRKIGSRLVKIEGNKGHPANGGALCPSGTAGLQMLYGPSRIKQPLKKVGSRWEGTWEPISWADAMEEVTRKVKELRAARESHLLACITNNADGTTSQLFERFLKVVGSSNFLRMNSGRDARHVTLKLMQGVDGDLAFDLEKSRHILSFGCSLLEGGGICTRTYRSYDRWCNKKSDGRIEIVQIEPNLSVTASKAAKWVPIEPGTEAALALGLAHVLIKERRYDKAFVDNYCFGFEDWADSDGKQHTGFKQYVLSRYSPQSVAGITKVPAEEIERIARDFADKQPSLAIGGGSSGDWFVSLYELMAVHSLNALVGNINQRGGVMIKPDVPVAQLPDALMDEEAERGFAVARLDEAGSSKFPFSSHLLDNLNSKELKMLFIHESNPYYAMADREIAENIFAHVPYIVSFSSFMDESAAFSDLILPLPTRFERWDDQFPAPDLPIPVYNLTKPIIDSLYDTKNAGDILIGLAQALGGTVAESFPWTGMEEVLKNRAMGLYESGRGTARASEDCDFRNAAPGSYSSFSSMWRELLDSACWFDPTSQHGNPKTVLKTSDSKFEFFSRRIMEAFQFTDDISCMPHFKKAKMDTDGFNLLLMPENMLLISDNGRGSPPFVIKQLSDDVLLQDELSIQISSITALYNNELKDGDRVLLESPHGGVVVRVHIYDGVRDGIVLIPLGFGHTAYDEFLKNKGINARRILATKKDPISGLPVWWATPGRITKV
jgi:anaerobic selenocysteine-containing dehydrogenase